MVGQLEPFETRCKSAQVRACFGREQRSHAAAFGTPRGRLHVAGLQALGVRTLTPPPSTPARVQTVLQVYSKAAATLALKTKDAALAKDADVAMVRTALPLRGQDSPLQVASCALLRPS